MRCNAGGECAIAAVCCRLKGDFGAIVPPARANCMARMQSLPAASGRQLKSSWPRRSRRRSAHTKSARAALATLLLVFQLAFAIDVRTHTRTHDDRPRHVRTWLTCVRTCVRNLYALPKNPMDFVIICAQNIVEALWPTIKRAAGASIGISQPLQLAVCPPVPIQSLFQPPNQPIMFKLVSSHSCDSRIATV